MKTKYSFILSSNKLSAPKLLLPLKDIAYIVCPELRPIELHHVNVTTTPQVRLFLDRFHGLVVGVLG